MRILSIIVFIVLLCIALYIKTHPDEYKNKALCEMFEEFKAILINGIISKKYKDKHHHLNEAFEVGIQKIDIGLDITGFYDYININDSIFKEAGSSKIILYRQGENPKEFEIDFGCKK